MARVCAICGKGPQVGNTRKLLRGHYNITGKRRFNPNLQKAKYEGKRVRACVACIRTESKKGKINTPVATTPSTTPAAATSTPATPPKAAK